MTPKKWNFDELKKLFNETTEKNPAEMREALSSSALVSYGMRVDERTNEPYLAIRLEASNLLSATFKTAFKPRPKNIPEKIGTLPVRVSYTPR